MGIDLRLMLRLISRLAGLITVTKLEDKMKRIIIILILLALSFGNFSCGGGGAGSSDSPKGENPGTPSIVQLLPSHNIAQTNSYITFYAKVLDGNGTGVPNTNVRFTNLSPIGVLSSTTEKTDDLGIATVTLKSTTSGFSTIQAEVNTGVAIVREKKTVFFSSYSTALSYLLNIDVSGKGDPYILFEPTQYPDDNTVTITTTLFQLLGSYVSYVEGSLVTFGADRPYKISSDPDAVCSDGSDSCDVIFPAGDEAITNSFGQASVPVMVVPATLMSISTTLNIYAQSDTGAFNMVTLFLQPVTVSSVSVSANPKSVKSGGKSTITAYATTTAGTPVPDGTTINFSTTIGGVEPFSQTTDGIAEAEFTAPEVTSDTTATITASVGGKSGATTVTIIAPVIALTVQPSSQTVTTVGNIATYTIIGGIPPYKVFTSRPDITSFSTTDPTVNTTTVYSSGGTFTIVYDTAVPADVTVTITVMDSLGTSKTVDFKIDVP
jgi:hypothetical protein